MAEIGTEFINAFGTLNAKGLKGRELLVFGAGNMAGCLVEAFVAKGCFKHDEIVLITKSEASALKWKTLGFGRSLSIQHYLDEFKDDQATFRIVMIGVKPQYRLEFYELLSSKEVHFNAQIVCSILAGVTHAMLKNELYTHKLYYGPIVRLTPNVPCAVGSGLTLLYGNDSQIIDITTKLLKAAGDVRFVPEASFNAASAVAGSGPAFAFLIAEALADGGVLAGLQREDANRIAAQMLRGAADLLLQTGKHPGQLKDQVCSPGGATIAGIRELEKRGVRSALIEAVLATKEKADKLAS